MKRTGRLRPVSAKRAKDNRIRARIIRDRCELAGHAFECMGPIDLHEILRASQSSTSRTDERLVIGLCRRHHDLDLFENRAKELGIRLDPHEWRLCEDADAEQVLLDVAEARRILARRVGVPGGEAA